MQWEIEYFGYPNDEYYIEVYQRGSVWLWKIIEIEPPYYDHMVDASYDRNDQKVFGIDEFEPESFLNPEEAAQDAEKFFEKKYRS